MKILGLMFCLAVAFLPASGEMLIDFSNPVKLWIVDSRARGQKFSGSRFFWKDSNSPYLEFFLEKPLLLRKFKKKEFSVDVEIPPRSELLRFALRFTDREGEVFQYVIPTAGLMPGKHTLRVMVDAEHPAKLSWGKKKNGRFDWPLMLCGGAIAYPEKTVEGSLQIFRIQDEVSKDVDALKKIRVELSTASNPIRVYNPECEDTLRISLENCHDGKQHIRFSCRMRDHENILPGEISKDLVLCPGRRIELELPVPAGRGIRYVDYLLSNGKNNCTGTRSFAVMVPAGPTPGKAEGFLFGVQAHPQRYPRKEQELEAQALALCGAKVIRHGLQWEIIQPRKDEWNFSSSDFTVDCFGRYGVEFESAFLYTPRWAIAEDWNSLKHNGKVGRPLPDRKAFAEYVRQVVSRYKGRIRFFEVWNEPDLVRFADFPVEQYVELLKIAWMETKKIDPQAVVMTGGFACMPPNQALADQRYMEKALTLGHGSYDVVAFHGHGSFGNYENQVGRLLALRHRLGIENIPWYPNETAISSVNIGEFKQAETLFRKLIFSWAAGAIGYTWYDLRNDGYDSTNQEHNFGMLTKDFYPKAIYCVYNTLARHLRGGRFLGEKRFPEGGRFFSFSAKEGRLTAYWNESRNGNNGELYWIRSNAERAFLIDLFDNAIELPLREGYLLLPVGRQPGMLRLEPGNAEFAVQGIFAVFSGNTLLPGLKRVPFQLTFRNPLKRPLQFRPVLQLPAGISQERPLPEVHIPAEGSLQYSGTLTVSPERLFRKDPELRLSGRLDGRPCPAGMKIVLRRAIQIPRGSYAVEPTFVLNSIQHYRTLAPSDPGRPHLQWQGVDDLSLQLYPAFDQKVFRLKVVIKDDRHSQPFSGGDVWKDTMYR